MKQSKFSEEQIIAILREAEKGEQTITAICRSHSISENTFYKWRQKYGGLEVADARRLLDLVESIPSVKGRRGRPRRKPKVVQGDRGYDSEPHRQALKKRGSSRS
jgi:putative transposase